MNRFARVAVPIVALVALSVAPAGAATLAGIELPDQLKVGDATLALNGLGLREATFLKVDVYVAGLYLPARTSDAEAILGSDDAKVLHMHFVRKVGRDDITEAWVEGFEKNAGDLAPLRDRLDTLNGYMQDMTKGDTIRFTWDGSATTVAVNGADKGSIDGADFARGLFSVFVGPEPPNPGLKTGLLGR